ncbi:NACHT domain-containing protein [Micromonospora sp. CPCC 206061]|uniref:NACHT domain-containing protein n=1 Tax=Micromonospora sp. CPCC 206061 TaxID=3122410 RepID=UPI002FEF225A
MEAKLFPLLPENVSEDLLTAMSDQERRNIVSFLGSAQFEQVALHVTVSIYNGADEVDLAAAREELRLSLRLALGPEAHSLYEATELIYNLVVRAANETLARLQVPGSAKASSSLVATSAKMSAASVRNCEVMKHLGVLSEVDAFTAALRAQIKAAYGTMKLPHAALSRPLPYSKIYVPQYISRYTDSRDAGPLGGKPLIDANTLVSTQLRFVLLGDPGAGKSTFASKFAFDLATDRVPILQNRVPLLVILRDHTDMLRESADSTLLDCIKASCGRPHHVFPSLETIEHVLLSGRAILILDGVDELGDSSLRGHLAQLITGFANRYPLTQMVVTSRVVGYFDAPLDADQFPTYAVRPFVESQIASYVGKWFAASSALYQEPSQQLADAFLVESAAAAADLRSNPLLLSLLCGMYASMQYIPRNRPEVYEKCAEMLFERWDKSRGVHVPLRFAADIRPAVQQLAWRLLTDTKQRVALPREEILRFLTEYLKSKRYEDEDEALQAANDFLAFCAGRAWALAEVGSTQEEPVYGFTHRTFLEYFAASRLVRQNPDPKAVWEEISSKINDSSWREVGLLAVQILDRTVEDGGNDLLALVLADGKSRLSHLAFVADAFRSIYPSPGLGRELARQTAQAICSISTTDRLPIIYEPKTLEHFFAIDDLVISLFVRQYDYRNRIVEMLVIELTNLVGKSPWWRDPAALFLAVLAKLVPSRLPREWSVSALPERGAGPAQKWQALFRFTSTVDLKRLPTECIIGHPLFFSGIRSAPAEVLLRNVLQATESGDQYLAILKRIESRFLTVRLPWVTIRAPQRPVPLPRVQVEGPSKLVTHLTLDELRRIPAEAQAIAAFLTMPYVEVTEVSPELLEKMRQAVAGAAGSLPIFSLMFSARNGVVATDEWFRMVGFADLLSESKNLLELWLSGRVSVTEISRCADQKFYVSYDDFNIFIEDDD